MSENTDTPSTDMVQYQATSIEEYRPRILMAPDEAKALDDQLRESMRAVLREDVDFGKIPGAGDKKNLLKPGAEKLLQWFGFGQRSIEVKIEREDPDHPTEIADKAHRVGVTYRTEVFKTIPGHGEVIVATCEAYAGYDEDRYFQTDEQARAKAEEKERNWARKDRREPKPDKWQYATGHRAPWNTVVKMCQKRSLVGAAIDATAAAGLFTQDMEDQSSPVGVAADTLAAVGRAAVEKLPAAIGGALNDWYRKQRWPDPDEWTAEQWCSALIQAGWLQCQHPSPASPATNGQDGRQSAPAEPGNGAEAAAVTTETASDPWTARDDPEQPGPDWSTVVARAGKFKDDAEGQKLWAAVLAAHNQRKITKDKCERLKAAIRARWAELSNSGDGAVEGVVVPSPAQDEALGQWADAIDGITSQDDAHKLAADLDKQHRGGVIDSRRAKAIRTAIQEKARNLPKAGAAA